jgi:hypothetical protein
MKGSVKLPVFIDDARKYVNTTQLRAKYLGASYEAEYCQWQALHGLGSLMETASLIITPNAYLEGKLIASYPPDPIGDLSVTRATTATRVNSAGLVELVPYNVIRYSQEFDNASWSYYQATITPNIITAPDGTMTGDRLNQATGTGGNVVYSNETLSTGNITLSAYLKLGTGSFGAVSLYDGSWKNGYFNLTTGAVHYTDPGVTASIQDAGNGWWRCIITINSVSNSVTTNVGHVLNTGEFGYIWGAQLVEGSTAKDYQKTETRLNIPRLDYSNGTCPSLLVEPQRTNILTWSSSFDNAAWIKSSGGTGSLPVITPNTTISPSGVQDADTIFLNSGSGTTPSDQSQFYQTMSVVSGTIYTMSFYAKGSVGGEQIMVRHAGAGSYTKITLTNQWARYSVTETAVFTGVVTPAFLIRRGLLEPINASATFYLWGAQAEAGSYATSYIPTTSASVTRNADVISKTGISSLIGTEFTLFYDGYETTGGSSTRYVVLKGSGGTYENLIILETSTANRIALTIKNNAGGNEFFAISNSLTDGQRVKIGIRCKNNDFAFYVNGVLLGSQLSGSVPTTSDLYLGYYTDYADNYTIVNSLAIWQQALTDNQLEQLTTL